MFHRIQYYCGLYIANKDEKDKEKLEYFYDKPVSFLFQEWENRNITNIVIYFSGLVTCTLMIYIICYIGQLLLDEV